MSLRRRLVAAIVVVGAVLVIAGVAVAGLIRGALIDQVDQQLERATGPLGVFIGAVEAGVPVGPSDGLGPSPGGEEGERFTELYVAVGSSEGMRVFGPTYGEDAPPDLVEVMPAPGTQVDREFKTVDAVGGDGPRYRVLLEGVPGGGAIAVAQSLRDTDNTYRQIVTVEVLAFLAVLLTLAVAAWWLLRHGVRPLDKMAATANAIADGDLSRRVEPAEAATEVGRLGIALNTMLGQIEEAFDERQESEDRLRRFVADASHELRTPLTSIRGYAELWRQGAIATEGEQADAMRRMEHEAARMGRLVDDMLLLARLDEGRPLDLVPVDLGFIAEDAVRDAVRWSPVVPSLSRSSQVWRCSAMRTGSAKSPRTCSPTRGRTRHQAHRSRCGCRVTPRPRCSRSPTTGPDSLRRSPRACSSDLSALIRHGRGRRAGPGSDWRSSRLSRTRTAGRRRFRRCRVKVRRSASCCPLR